MTAPPERLVVISFVSNAMGIGMLLVPLNFQAKSKRARFFEKSKCTLVLVDDETEFVQSGQVAKGKARVKKEIENKKKKDVKCDIPTLKLRTASRLLPHLRFLSTALKDAHVKYEAFKTTFASIYDIFEKVTAEGISHEDSVEIHKYADADQVGLIKLPGPHLQTCQRYIFFNLNEYIKQVERC